MNEYEEISFEIIEHYFNIGKYNEVIELVKEKIQDDIENGFLWYMLGSSNYAIEVYDEAADQLHEALNLGYDKEVIFHILAHLYMDTEQWQEAEASFLEVLRLNPNNAITHASYAKLMKKTGHRKKSKYLIEKAMELDPECAHVLSNYIILQTVNGDKELHRLTLEQYMNSEESELAKLLHLGWNASLQHKEKEANEYYRQAFLLNPEDKNLLSILEEMEISTHPLLLPNRIVNRLGGIGIIWTIVIALNFFGFEYLSELTLPICLYLTIYIIISILLVKGLRKIRSYRHG